MKTMFYLYEVNNWKELYPSIDVSMMPSRIYIDMHLERLQELLESNSTIASDKYALEHDTCPIGAYGKIVKDRNDAIEFWNTKLLEL